MMSEKNNFVRVVHHLEEEIKDEKLKNERTYRNDKQIVRVNFVVHIDKSNQYKRNNNNLIVEEILHKRPVISDMENIVHTQEEKEMIFLAFSLMKKKYSSIERKKK